MRHGDARGTSVAICSTQETAVNASSRIALTIASLFQLSAATLDAPEFMLETKFHDRLVPAGHYEETFERPDLYGNEVINAVSTYQLDETGGLYEVHAPQMELPRLGAPEG